MEGYVSTGVCLLTGGGALTLSWSWIPPQQLQGYHSLPSPMARIDQDRSAPSSPAPFPKEGRGKITPLSQI